MKFIVNKSFSLWANGLFRWELHTKLKWYREVPSLKKEAFCFLCLEKRHQISHWSMQADSSRPQHNSACRHPRRLTNKSYQLLRLQMGTYYTGRGITTELRRCLQFAVMTVSHPLQQGQWRPSRKLHLPMHHIVCQELLGINKGSFGAWPHCSFLSPGHSWVNSVQCCMMKKERKEGRYQSEWVKTGIHNCYFGCYHKLLLSQVSVTNEANHGEFKSDPTAQGSELYALCHALAVEQTWSYHVLKDGERLIAICMLTMFIYSWT